ncbi:MAG: hypothetical protein EXS48_02615 [Candidatus Staskawiczbacteria bacterium]|nr:hypothetical protein [Candidatus Staskawiczbacteria bacterium]
MIEQLGGIVSQLVVLGIVIYALLLIAGAPFGGPKKFANPFAKWVWNRALDLTIWTIKLPFRLLARLVFGKKQQKKKKKK